MRTRSGDIWSIARLIWIAADYIVSKSYDSSVFSSSAAFDAQINRAALLTPLVLVQLLWMAESTRIIMHLSDSWIFCFSHNDNSGLVRISYISDWAFVVCLARLPRRKRTNPDRGSCKFSMGLKWGCIFVANNRANFATRGLLLIVPW